MNGGMGSRWMFARLRVCRIGGIVFSLHWTWFPSLLAMIAWRGSAYTSPLGATGEIAGLFGLVLLHELGHVVAARRFGHTPAEVVLWPLGGVAIVDLPTRWSNALVIAASGPAVNLLLVPLTALLWSGLGNERGGDLNLFLASTFRANLGLLLFNLLPIWPLDGGRIVEAALWSRFGLARSRLASSLLGVGCGALSISWFWHNGAYGVVALLIALILICAVMLQWSLSILLAEKSWGQHESAVCPWCRSRALNGPTGHCQRCGEPFNAFAQGGRCWNCDSDPGAICCPYCGEASEPDAWRGCPPTPLPIGHRA